jgi:hypothetical protein
MILKLVFEKILIEYKKKRIAKQRFHRDEFQLGIFCFHALEIKNITKLES